MTPRRTALTASVLAVLAALPHLCGLRLDFISDDWLHIDLARRWGPMSGWSELASDPLYRCRATSLIWSYWIDSLAGLTPWVYTAGGILLHTINVWLVALMGSWRRIGWSVSIPAAGFFAVHEIHQGAILWHAAVPELFVFGGVLGCVLAFVHGRPLLASLAFVFALASKESGVAAVPLLFLAAWMERKSFKLPIVFALLSGLYALAIFYTSSQHLHLNDGTFSFHAPVFLTLRNSIGRLLWFWGLSALVYLAWRRAKDSLPLLGFAAAWTLTGLLPYAFLTYMPRVPSRHTYLAALGVALLVGLAWSHLNAQRRRWAAVLALAIVLHNTLYVWIRKYPQYVELTVPTENLIRHARSTTVPFHLTCFEYSREVAVSTLRLAAPGKENLLRFEPKGELDEFCAYPPIQGKKKSPVAPLPGG